MRFTKKILCHSERNECLRVQLRVVQEEDIILHNKKANQEIFATNVIKKRNVRIWI